MFFYNKIFYILPYTECEGASLQDSFDPGNTNVLRLSDCEALSCFNSYVSLVCGPIISGLDQITQRQRGKYF